MSNFVDQFLQHTHEQIYICSLSNIKGEGVGERHVLTRDLKAIKHFIEEHDVKGRGVFYCVGTLLPGQTRNKANVQEVWLLHADVDFKSIDVTPEEALKTILALPLPPTRIHATGNGYHCLWQLKAASTEFDLVEGLLRKLAQVLGGDRQVAHRAALMRLPGTHNSKNDKWLEVKTIHDTTKRYTLEQLEAWLVDAPMAIHPKGRAEENPFIQYGREAGFKAPVDVEARLKRMAHGGAGDDAIHATQLAVSASMLNAGVDVEEVVETLMEATRRAGESHWNWVEEERNIRKMCVSWLVKHPELNGEEKRSEQQSGFEMKTNGAKTKPAIHATPFKWMDPSKIPLREWLYRPHYIRRFLSLLVAQGGVGKTVKVIAECLAMVTGKPTLGVKPERVLRVWLLERRGSFRRIATSDCSLL